MKKVTLYPELIASYLRINLEKEFLVWCVIRTVGDSTGIVNYSDIVNIISNIYNISKTQSYQIAKNGINIFWRKSNNNKKLTDGAKVLWTVGALVFSIITAIIYYFTQKK